jgi:hypothetical protein
MAVERLPHTDSHDEKNADEDGRKVLGTWKKMRARLATLEKRCGSTGAAPVSAR